MKPPFNSNDFKSHVLKPEGPVMDVMDMDDMQSASQHQQQSVVDDYDEILLTRPIINNIIL